MAAPARHDWTREDIAAPFHLPCTEPVFRAGAVHRAHRAAGKVQLRTRLSIKATGCALDGSAGREGMAQAMRAPAFRAGANSIFTGDRLLTAASAADDADAALFGKLGLKSLAGPVPMRAVEEVAI